MRKLHGDFRDIYHVAPIALGPRKLYYAFWGIIFSVVGLVIINAVFLAKFGLGAAGPSEIIEVASKARADRFIQLNINLYTAIFNAGWRAQVVYLVAAFNWLWFVWSFYGAVITRMAAVDLVRETSRETYKAGSFAARRFFSYFMSAAAVEITIAILGAVIVLAAMLVRIPGLGGLFWVLNAVFFPLAILAGIALAFFIIGGLFGSIFLMPTISVEGSDAFDAVSRAYTYFFQAPVRYFFYLILNALYGIITGAIVLAFAFVVYKVTMLCVAIGLGDAGALFERFVDYHLFGVFRGDTAIPETPVWYIQFAGWFAVVWFAAMFLFIGSYLITFFFTGSTVSYLLMRRATDCVDIDSVFIDTDEDTDKNGNKNPGEEAGEKTGEKPDPETPSSSLTE